MDDDDIKWLMKMVFGTIFLLAVAPIVLNAMRDMIPPLIVGGEARQSEPAVYGQQWYDPATGRWYVYAPVVD